MISSKYTSVNVWTYSVSNHSTEQQFGREPWSPHRSCITDSNFRKKTLYNKIKAMQLGCSSHWEFFYFIPGWGITLLWRWMIFGGGWLNYLSMSGTLNTEQPNSSQTGGGVVPLGYPNHYLSPIPFISRRFPNHSMKPVHTLTNNINFRRNRTVPLAFFVYLYTRGLSVSTQHTQREKGRREQTASQLPQCVVHCHGTNTQVQTSAHCERTASSRLSL